MSEDTQKAKRIKKRYEESWISIPGVTAVGVGLTAGNEVGIIVSVTAEPEKIRKQIPERVKGIPVELQITGEIKAQ